MYPTIGGETFDPRTRRGIKREDDSKEPEDQPPVTYWDVVINSMAKLDKNSIDAVNDMTLTEYHCLIHARHEKDLYQEYVSHRQAFLHREVKATKNVGTKNKPKEEHIFKSFDDFFDYEKALKNLKNFDQEQEKRAEETRSRKQMADRVAEMNRRKKFKK